MRNEKKIAVSMILIIFITGCNHIDGQSDNIQIVSDSTNLIMENGNISNMDNTPIAIDTSIPEAEINRFQKVKLPEEYRDVNFFMNWYSDTEMYSVINDIEVGEQFYMFINLIEANNFLDQTFASRVSEREKRLLSEYFDFNVKQIYKSNDGNQYLLLVWDPDELEKSWKYSYDIWMYNQLTEEYHLIIDQESKFQSNCPLDTIFLSSVSWIEGNEYVYMFCGTNYGQMLINTTNGQYYSLYPDITSGIQTWPIFSRNGGKVIIKEEIYWSSDYIYFLENCQITDDSINLDETEKKKCLDDLEEKRIMEIPEQLGLGPNMYQWDHNAQYYYYHEISNGLYDETNSGNILKMNILTGETEIVIPSNEIQANELLNNDVTMIVSPDGQKLLFRSIYWKDFVYIYEIK